jgi:pilus assembly protein FimV
VDQPIDLDQALATEELSGADSEVLDLDAMPGDGEEDDVSTKLDLARAYVEMGDQDGARSILEEVVSEGNEGQKDEAQKLLADIG